MRVFTGSNQRKCKRLSAKSTISEIVPVSWIFWDHSIAPSQQLCWVNHCNIPLSFKISFLVRLTWILINGRHSRLSFGGKPSKPVIATDNKSSGKNDGKLLLKPMNLRIHRLSILSQDALGDIPWFYWDLSMTTGTKRHNGDSVHIPKAFIGGSDGTGFPG